MRADRWIWIDLEMTGLYPEQDVIIEIATLVTDADLNLIEKGPNCAIYQPESLLAGMDDWNQKHHTASGLIDRVRQSTITVKTAERLTLEFLAQHVAAGVSPMCGNSIHQDRRFLYKYMPDLERYFHYRHLDVSTVRVIMSHWSPSLLDGFKKKSSHKALEDAQESLEELKYYRSQLFKK